MHVTFSSLVLSSFKNSVDPGQLASSEMKLADQDPHCSHQHDEYNSY